MRIAKNRVVAALALALVMSIGPAYAQDTEARPAQQNKPAEKPMVPLKVQITLSRYDGEKKISNLPFTLWVNANDPSGTDLNLGSSVPVSAGGNNIQYRNIGTNLSCSATEVADGRFRLYLSVNDSSVDPAKDSAGNPNFQSFQTKNYLLLRDGQTAQFVAATDKVTGQVTKVDVTITVLK